VAGVVGVTGVALLIYAGLLFRDAQRAAAQEPASRSIAAPPQEKLALFGLPLGFVALLAALASLGLTPVVLLTGTQAATLAALLWTLIITLTAIFLFYRRVYHYLSTFRMGVLFALRTTAIMALVALLFQPLSVKIRYPEAKPKLSIVIDASGSMRFPISPTNLIAIVKPCLPSRTRSSRASPTSTRSSFSPTTASTRLRSATRRI